MRIQEVPIVVNLINLKDMKNDQNTNNTLKLKNEIY